MDQPSIERVTQLLDEVAAGDRSAEGRLFALVRTDLHERAHRMMRAQPADHTLQTTALVHEAWLKLEPRVASGWKSRAHFLCVASAAMRSILVDHARAQAAGKRGGAGVRVPLEDEAAAGGGAGEDLIALDEALDRLAGVDAELARVANLRLFGGLSHDEVGRALGISTRTVERAWRLARAWLQRELGGQGR
jgi:RNA polymerase sigma factor (TIGR02999 family)